MMAGLVLHCIVKNQYPTVDWVCTPVMATDKFMYYTYQSEMKKMALQKWAIKPYGGKTGLVNS